MCQRLADEVRTIIKKGWFSDHKILEMHKKVIDNVIIQYLTHQKLSNKNCLTEMKSHFRKMEKPHSQTTHNQETRPQEQKVNLGNLKGIMNSEKTTLPSLRNRIEIS